MLMLSAFLRSGLLEPGNRRSLRLL